ncbi:MAG: hypothetical protein EAZ55_12785 [Cytophagales bacterium]|nr:MAG: hypothetical protein EAZ55_12785 [Cytophagales bacterium]
MWYDFLRYPSWGIPLIIIGIRATIGTVMGLLTSNVGNVHWANELFMGFLTGVLPLLVGSYNFVLFARWRVQKKLNQWLVKVLQKAIHTPNYRLTIAETIAEYQLDSHEAEKFLKKATKQDFAEISLNENNELCFDFSKHYQTKLDLSIQKYRLN